MLGEADREEVRLEIVDAKNISERSTFKAGGHLGNQRAGGWEKVTRVQLQN